MRDAKAPWENLRLLTGSDERVLLIECKSEELKSLLGKSLAAIAKSRGRSVRACTESAGPGSTSGVRLTPTTRRPTAFSSRAHSRPKAP